jgi:hypothetical protein
VSGEHHDDVSEERALGYALIAAGSLPVIGWLVHGGAAGAGITLCFAMIGAGMVALWRGRRAGLPRATLR